MRLNKNKSQFEEQELWYITDKFIPHPFSFQYENRYPQKGCLFFVIKGFLMISFFSSNLVWLEGLYILFVITGIAAIGLLWYKPIFYVALGLFMFTFYFFRNPERVCLEAATDSKVLICPADGKIVDVQFDESGGFQGYTQKISIFLSPFDVHVNWAPMSGVITKVKYVQGSFKAAFLPKSSELNEHNDIEITAYNNKKLLVRQIAGAVARRICCWVQKDDAITAGDKYGMIRFGSRVDILLPNEVQLAIGLGQRVYGGQTVLGRWTCDMSG